MKNRPFLDGQEKSNFQNFSTKFYMLFENILNYLNINFHEKILKIGFFLAKKRRAKSSDEYCSKGSYIKMPNKLSMKTDLLNTV